MRENSGKIVGKEVTRESHSKKVVAKSMVGNKLCPTSSWLS